MIDLLSLSLSLLALFPSLSLSLTHSPLSFLWLILKKTQFMYSLIDILFEL